MDQNARAGVIGKSATFARMIKLSHTIFALPFAFAALVLASRDHTITAEIVFWIILAMIGARSAAMGFNRLVDAEYDARNPRTADRDMARGALTRGEALFFIAASALLLLYAAAQLSPLALLCAFPLLAVLFVYSYTKRFTWGAHIVLGLAIGGVPMAVWVAVAGTIPFESFIMSIALLTYIAGLDILYSTQDVAFDTKEGLHSIPALFGVRTALIISTLFHVLSFLALLWLYWLYALSAAYLAALALIGILFFIEHALVRPDDLSKVPFAFNTVNSAISVMVFVAFSAGVFLG